MDTLKWFSQASTSIYLDISLSIQWSMSNLCSEYNAFLMLVDYIFEFSEGSFLKLNIINTSPKLGVEAPNKGAFDVLNYRLFCKHS